MATLWLTELIPLVVTAFLPLVLFPLFGILKSAEVATQYVNNTIFLLIAGFLVALTLERWNLHERFSLKILTLCGNRPSLLLLGMMAASFFLSLFVSNTATTLMMVPNAVSVCSILESTGNPTYRQFYAKRFTTSLLLGIAYAANIGGMASLIGTAPNLVLQRQLEVLFPDSPEITFATWISFGLPIGLVMFIIVWAYLCMMYLQGLTMEDKRDFNLDSENSDTTSAKELFSKKYAQLGFWSREQIFVSILFSVLCLLWVFRSDLDFGSFVIRGWSNIFPEPSFISDGTTGMAIAVILFLVPARSSHLASSTILENDSAHEGNDKKQDLENKSEGSMEQHLVAGEGLSEIHDTTLLDWDTANQMPYDVVFLLGGGFALAKAFVSSGLSIYLGDLLAGMEISLAALVFLMITLIIWLTELTSNTSTSNIMVPIAASIAVAARASPYTLMVPAAMACSCAFVLPIATPPNMVVFSTGRLPMREMNKAGFLLNAVCSLILLAATYTIIPVVFGVDADEFPQWAENNEV